MSADRPVGSARSAAALSALAALLVGHFGAVLAGVLGNAAAVLPLLAVAFAADLFAQNRLPGLILVLRRLQFTLQVRALVRELAVVVLLAAVDPFDDPGQLALLGGVLALITLRIAWLLLLVPLRRRANPPVLTRNVDLRGIPDTGVPRADVLRDGSIPLQLMTIVPLTLGVLALAAGAPGWLVVPALLALGPMAARAALVAAAVLRLRHRPSDERLLLEVNRRVQELSPEVVLYFSGVPEEVYQVNMWLPVLAGTRRPVLVVLRERAVLRLLGATDAPVVCIPQPTDLMRFPLPTVKVALYAANIGKNIHFLRLPGIKHVFIGHGDSDKVASVNPFTKVHDEVWVAGPAGRERYRLAKVGVRDDTIVEVGRPQLGEIDVVQRPAGRERLTVLYAPTWEGWTGDPFHTSLVLMGPALIEALLAAGVRVIYKPHPLTGRVEAAAAAASQRIVAAIRAEEARLGRPPVAVDPFVDLDDEQTGEAGEAPTFSQERERSRAWSQAYWQSEGADRNLVVTDAHPTLYDCFNHAEVLVSDISSVVADWIASRKPYVVTNPADLDAEQFRTRYPTARAAYLLGSGLVELASILEAVQGPDPLAPERSSLRTYLLGSDDRDPLTTWNDAVDRLYDLAVRTWPDAVPWEDAAELGDDDPPSRPGPGLQLDETETAGAQV